jgi:hypothetical protein
LGGGDGVELGVMKLGLKEANIFFRLGSHHKVKSTPNFKYLKTYFKKKTLKTSSV